MNEHILGYIAIGMCFAIFLWYRIKLTKETIERIKIVKTMTPDFFDKKRTEMIKDDYEKWLRKFYTVLLAEIYERKEKGFEIKPEFINALILTEDEVEKTGGIKLDKRASDEFKP